MFEIHNYYTKVILYDRVNYISVKYTYHDLNSLKREKKFSSYWHHVWQVRPQICAFFVKPETGYQQIITLAECIFQQTGFEKWASNHCAAKLYILNTVIKVQISFIHKTASVNYQMIFSVSIPVRKTS